MPQTIWIARHANRLDFVHPEWFNTAEHPYDPPLADSGFIQAQQLAKRLAGCGISHIFASPFLRTVQTAHEVAQVLNLPLKLEAGLSEWLNPDWMPAMPEKLSLEALQQLFPEIDISYSSRILPTYPETESEVFQRAGLTARRLAEEYPEDILLVGHSASVFGAILGLTNGMADPEMKVPLCSLFKLVRHGEEWVIGNG